MNNWTWPHREQKGWRKNCYTVVKSSQIDLNMGYNMHGQTIYDVTHVVVNGGTCLPGLLMTNCQHTSFVHNWSIRELITRPNTSMTISTFLMSCLMMSALTRTIISYAYVKLTVISLNIHRRGHIIKSM